ncbi:DUF423 domain-containing protein [Paracrocinitomix mangrovi]|uniref:DUF423 domain-containing protein n=1 Tax=Paracrocinitomix mangrovi TaxID=2862509 RepID=UPI001C8D20F7|nr:DUF423 domain-containing protein [Paracrocinitomix mangrovi]UKN01270.1 DUF423 domain-containing protein [Paracrocinitomix mangrovi]
MNKKIVITAAILICLSIILGAFAAHGLKKIINEEGIIIFEKGVKYQMYTGLALLAIGLSADKFQFSLKWFFNLALIGVIIFAGLLYVLSFKEHEAALKICSAIVPVGGSLMIISWIILIYQMIRKR